MCVVRSTCPEELVGSESHAWGLGSNRGLEATYTEHNSITNENPENRSKSGARNQRCLHLDYAAL
jgi:hypothetical protein